MRTTILHSSFVEVTPRAATTEERGWIHDIVSANLAWAGVQLGDLIVVAKCICGCRSIALKVPERIQNPKLAGRQGLVGELDLGIRFRGKDDFASILLHFVDGNLSVLEVIWYNFPEPVPDEWIEASRDLRVGD